MWVIQVKSLPTAFLFISWYLQLVLNRKLCFLQRVYLYFRGSGKEAEMRREAARGAARAAFWWNRIYISTTHVLFIVWSVCRSTDICRVGLVYCKSSDFFLPQCFEPFRLINHVNMTVLVWSKYTWTDKPRLFVPYVQFCVPPFMNYYYYSNIMKL